MRILHTSDWHIGRGVRGRSRAEEHTAVLAEIADIVRKEKIELVLIAGDLFDHNAPAAGDEEVAYQALLEIQKAGAQIALISGNHDHPDRLEALAPFLKLANIRAGAKLRNAENGGTIEIAGTKGEVARIAMMPWLRRGNIITADDLMETELARNQSRYSASWRWALHNLSSSFTADSINIVLAHVVFTGALVGGGERPSETTEDYWVPRQDLELNGTQYLGLGHIHKQQNLGLTVPAWYSGSPLQLDFGEEDDDKGVLVFEAKAGLPISDVRPIRLSAGRKMLTIPGKNHRNHENPGSLEHLKQLAASGVLGDAYLRVYVNEPARPGLADEVREVLPNAVEVKVAQVADLDPLSTREGVQPRDLLSMYLEQHKVQQDGVLDLFDELMEEEIASPST